MAKLARRRRTLAAGAVALGLAAVTTVGAGWYLAASPVTSTQTEAPAGAPTALAEVPSVAAPSSTATVEATAAVLAPTQSTTPTAEPTPAGAPAVDSTPLPTSEAQLVASTAAAETTPSSSGAVVGAAASPTATPTVTPEPARTHVIVAGDQLGKLGLQYGVTAESIRQANNIANVNALQIGQVLVIPSPQ